MPRAYSSIFALICWISSGNSDERPLATFRKSAKGLEEISRDVYLRARRSPRRGQGCRAAGGVDVEGRRGARGHLRSAGARGQRARRHNAAGRRRARRQRHLAVVVEHRNHARLQIVRVVHGLERHAARDGAVANHRDAVVLRAALLGLADGHAEGRGDGRGGMAGAKGVVLRLGALRKAGEATILTEGGHALAAAREDLVRIDLMGHVEDDRVLGRLKNVVQRHRQLHDPERGAQVPTRLGDGIDGLPAQLVRELLQLIDGEAAHVARIFHRVQERRRPGTAVRRLLLGAGRGLLLLLHENGRGRHGRGRRMQRHRRPCLHAGGQANGRGHDEGTHHGGREREGPCVYTATQARMMCRSSGAQSACRRSSSREVESANGRVPLFLD